MVISNIAAPLLGLVDTAIIGHLPDPIYLSAVALGAMCVSFLYLMAIFLRMSSTGLVAQALGAQDVSQQRQVFINASLFAVVLGVILILTTPWIIHILFKLVEANTDLRQLTSEYVRIRLLGAPAALLMLVVLGVLLGLQKARAAMLLVIFTNAINVLGDVVFVIGLGMDVRGAALASIIAEWSTSLIGLVIIIRHLDVRWQHCFRFDRYRYAQLARINSDIFVRSLMLHLCMAMMTAWASYQGQVVVAANAVLLQFLLLISLGLDGIAYAVEALIGQAKGQRDSKTARKWFAGGLVWSTLFAMVYALVFWIGGSTIIRLITNMEEVITVAQIYLPWIVILPLLAHWSYLFDGVFIGLSASRAMRNTMLFAGLVVFFPVWWLTQAWGNHGLWFSLCCFMLARGAAQAVVLKKHQLLSFSSASTG